MLPWLKKVMSSLCRSDQPEKSNGYARYVPGMQGYDAGGVFPGHYVLPVQDLASRTRSFFGQQGMGTNKSSRNFGTFFLRL
jgi:hypothetical protein